MKSTKITLEKLSVYLVKNILLKPGVYNLSNIKQVNNIGNSVTCKDVSDGKELK